MKLIIAGSRTFTDYQKLCQVLAPDRHRIAQVITGGAGARTSSATAGRGSTPCAISSSARSWSASASPQACAVTHQMAQAGDVLVAFWDQQSPGTAHDPVHAAPGQAGGGGAVGGHDGPAVPGGQAAAWRHLLWCQAQCCSVRRSPVTPPFTRIPYTP